MNGDVVMLVWKRLNYVGKRYRRRWMNRWEQRKECIEERERAGGGKREREQVCVKLKSEDSEAVSESVTLSGTVSNMLSGDVWIRAQKEPLNDTSCFVLVMSWLFLDTRLLSHHTARAGYRSKVFNTGINSFIWIPVPERYFFQYQF